MAITVCDKLKSNFQFNCSEKASGGIEQEVKLINKSDINKITSTITIDDTNHTISNIAVETGVKALIVSSLAAKRLVHAKVTIKDTDVSTYFEHQLTFPTWGMTKDNIIALRALANGAELIAIVKTKLGANQNDVYQVYGWDTGLKLIEAPYDSNANQGNINITIGSKEPDLEPNPPYIFFKTDAATTKAAYDVL